MHRLLACAVLLLASTEAFANKICVVDFSTSVGETSEGKAALQRLKTIEGSRTGELGRLQSELQKAAADLQQRRAILSADKIAQEEQGLLLKQQELQQKYQQFQDEFQRTYDATIADLDEKVRAVAAEVARARKCTVLLDKAVVVFQAPEVEDISKALVERYDKAHPGK